MPDSSAAPGSTELTANHPSAGEIPQTPTTTPVQMAQIVAKANQSEMRIGLNTPAFGSVEVRTVVRASDVGVTIGSEKGDLRSLFANELPGIANALQQQSLRLNQVSFHQGFTFSGNSSSGGDSQPRSYASSRSIHSEIAEPLASDFTAPATEGAPNSSSSLNILA